MKKLYLIILSVFALLNTAVAQELTVKSFVLAPTDLSLSIIKSSGNFCNVKKLLRLDGADGYRKDVLRTIRERGEIDVLIKNVFSPQDITDPDMFASFLLYYGLLTIEGTKGCRLTLGIPNDCVRKMYNETFAE